MSLQFPENNNTQKHGHKAQHKQLSTSKYVIVSNVLVLKVLIKRFLKHLHEQHYRVGQYLRSPLFVFDSNLLFVQLYN